MFDLRVLRAFEVRVREKPLKITSVPIHYFSFSDWRWPHSFFRPIIASRETSKDYRPHRTIDLVKFTEGYASFVLRILVFHNLSTCQKGSMTNCVAKPTHLIVP